MNASKSALVSRFPNVWKLREAGMAMSRKDKYNSSGCLDMTAYLALRNIEREERLNKAKKRELQKSTLDTKTEWRNTNEK